MPETKPTSRRPARLLRHAATFATLVAALGGALSTASAQRFRADVAPRQSRRVMVVMPPQGPAYAAGQPVEVEWNGSWYSASVLGVDPTGSCRIHYEGWSDSWDEVVVPGRIRARGNAAGAPPRPPQVVVVPRPPTYPPNQPPVVYTPPRPPVYQPTQPPVVYMPPPPPVYVPSQPPVVYMPPQPPVYVPPQPPVVYVPPQPPVYVPQPPAYSSNVLVNGGFEATPLAPGSFQNLPGIPGWFNTFGSGFEVQAGVAGTPFEGRQLLELDGDAPTGIAQDVNVQRGAVYELRIAFSPRAQTNAADNRVGIYFDGVLVGRIEADGTLNADTRWQVSTFRVMANNSRVRVEIRDEGTPNSLGSYIDDVRLTLAR